MNREKFFKLIGLSAIAGAISPHIFAKAPTKIARFDAKPGDLSPIHFNPTDTHEVYFGTHKFIRLEKCDYRRISQPMEEVGVTKAMEMLEIDPGGSFMINIAHAPELGFEFFSVSQPITSVDDIMVWGIIKKPIPELIASSLWVPALSNIDKAVTFTNTSNFIIRISGLMATYTTKVKTA